MGYAEEQEASGIKIGDEVKVTRVAASYTNGWEAGWEGMDDFVGKIHKVYGVSGIWGFELEFGGAAKWFPYFVLEKVELRFKMDFSDYSYIARDENGELRMYEYKPVLDDGYWESSGDQLDAYDLDGFEAPDLSGIPWDKSLHELSKNGVLTLVATRTIIIDGKNIELSEASYQELKKSLNKG